MLFKSIYILNKISLSTLLII